VTAIGDARAKLDEALAGWSNTDVGINEILFAAQGVWQERALYRDVDGMVELIATIYDIRDQAAKDALNTLIRV